MFVFAFLFSFFPSSRKPGPWAAYVATDRFPSDVRWTIVGGARVVSEIEKKKHLIEVAPFGRLDQMLQTVYGGALPPQTSPLNCRSSHLIEAAKRGRLDQMLRFRRR